MNYDLYNEYKDLSVKIINKYYKPFLYLYADDIYAQGELLLLQAINAYDPSLGVKFSTYAFKNIYYGINKYIDVDLQGHQRRNIKSEGKFKMVITKPTFVSMNADRNTKKDQNLNLDNFFGYDELEFSNVDLRLTIEKICNELEEKAKYEHRYDKCALILELIYKNLGCNNNDIIPLVGIYSTTFYRKLKLIKEYMIEKNYVEDLKHAK